MILDPRPIRDYLYALKQAAAQMDALQTAALSRVADRHLARCKKNTPVGISPDSPTLRGGWSRSGVHLFGDSAFVEVFNPVHYAPFFEYGHRQTPGRLVFIELSPGQQLYGRAAKEVKKGPHTGKWGITIRLKKPFVKGAFVMTDSETRAQQELDAACRRIEAKLKGAIG